MFQINEYQRRCLEELADYFRQVNTLVTREIRTTQGQESHG